MGVIKHLRKSDEVLVLSGKDKGRRGKIQRSLMANEEGTSLSKA